MSLDSPIRFRSLRFATGSRTERRFPRTALLMGITVLVWLTGCAVRRPPTLPASLPPADTEAVLARAQGINDGLDTFKGVGRLEIVTPEFRRAGRAAWAGRLTGPKFRLDFIGAGLPAATVAGDGRRLYLRQTARADVQTRPSANPRLDDLLGLPVTVADLLYAMAGRLPELPYPRITAHPDPAADGVRLVFYDRFGAPRVQASLDGSGDRLRRLVFYRADGELLFRIAYKLYRPADAYRLPYRIEVSDEERVCRIQVARWWPDADVDERAFVLAPASRQPLESR
jgi:outer membrane biogenesis lipoprotein LolB